MEFVSDMNPIPIDGDHLTLDELYSIALDAASGRNPASGPRARMNASRAVIERLLASDAKVYGVNTGFGKMATRAHLVRKKFATCR